MDKQAQVASLARGIQIGSSYVLNERQAMATANYLINVLGYTKQQLLPLDEVKLKGLLRCNETEDLSPPYRCLKGIEENLIEIKVKRIMNTFGQPAVKVPSEDEIANILDECPYICFDNGCSGSSDAARAIHTLITKSCEGK